MGDCEKNWYREVQFTKSVRHIHVQYWWKYPLCAPFFLLHPENHVIIIIYKNTQCSFPGIPLIKLNPVYLGIHPYHLIPYVYFDEFIASLFVGQSICLFFQCKSFNSAFVANFQNSNIFYFCYVATVLTYQVNNKWQMEIGIPTISNWNR